MGLLLLLLLLRRTTSSVIVFVVAGWKTHPDSHWHTQGAISSIPYYSFGLLLAHRTYPRIEICNTPAPCQASLESRTIAVQRYRVPTDQSYDPSWPMQPCTMHNRERYSFANSQTQSSPSFRELGMMEPDDDNVPHPYEGYE